MKKQFRCILQLLLNIIHQLNYCSGHVSLYAHNYCRYFHSYFQTFTSFLSLAIHWLLVSHSLIPRPLPDLISQPWRKMLIFLHGQQDKMWEWPEDEAMYHIRECFQCIAHCIRSKDLACTVFIAVSKAHSGEQCAVDTSISSVQHTP